MLTLVRLRASEKRVNERETADASTVLHVFAVEDVAAGLDRRSNDHCVIEGEAVIAGESHGVFVCSQRDGYDVIKRSTKQP